MAQPEFVRSRAFRVGFAAPPAILLPSNTPASMFPPLEQSVIIFECALILAGGGFLVWFFFVPSGRAARARPAALTMWEITFSDFLFLAWLILVAGFLGQVLLRATVGHAFRTLPEGTTIELILYGSTFHVGAILAWLCAHALVRRSRQVAAPPETPSARVSPLQTIRDAVLTFLAVLPLASGAAMAWERLLNFAGLPTERQELVDLFVQTKSPVLLALMIALALVVAPVSEELVFRAGLFRFLRFRAPRWVAFTVSAGLFAMLHGNWVGLLPLFVLGLVFAAAYERTGRLGVPMLAHAFFNLNTLLLVLSGVGR
jgi:membrane protease YdiL (CAAX protease family)